MSNSVAGPSDDWSSSEDEGGLRETIGSNPWIVRILGTEVALILLAVVLTTLAGNEPGAGIALLNVLSGLAIITAMLIAVVSVLAVILLPVWKALH
jgi:hypothetical protein